MEFTPLRSAPHAGQGFSCLVSLGRSFLCGFPASSNWSYGTRCVAPLRPDNRTRAPLMPRGAFFGNQQNTNTHKTMKTQETINPSALYWATFNRFELRLPGEAVIDCSQSGPVDDAVAFWTPLVQEQAAKDAFRNGPAADSILAELKECGAWDTEELTDDDANWRRLVWIAACNIAEDDAPDCSEPVA